MRHFLDDKHAPGTPRTAPRVLLLAVTLCVLGGCAEKEADPVPPRATFDAELKTPSTVVTSDPALRPVITSRVEAVDAWLDIIRRLQFGEPVPADSYEDLLGLPAYRIIGDDRKRGNLNRRIMKWTMESIFGGQDAQAAITAQHPDLIANFTYLKDRLDIAAGFNGDFCTPALLDGLRDALTRYISPEDLPARIPIHFFAGTVLIGFDEPDRFAMDIGLAIAAGPDQTAKLLASRLYATLAPRDGVEPDLGRTGAEKLAGAFRMLRLTAVSSWLGEKDAIRFDGAHPLLATQASHASVMREDARLVLERISLMMNNLLDPVSETGQEKYGNKTHNFLRFNDRYETCGWTMADAIVAHAGEKGLREAAGGTVSFLRAYQAAALAPAPDGRRRPFPFPAGQFEDLITHLQTY
ncbi:hypothetical protein H8E07_16940 [bacterium]|nr:hypothetical protein [bacterium]